MSKRFRVFFYLEGDSAEAFEKVENKPRLVAQAVEFYLGLGSSFRALESRLEAIQEQLNREPVAIPVKGIRIAKDDTDKKLDRLIEKTLLV